MADITYIPIRQLYPHPDNPRKELGDLSELAASTATRTVSTLTRPVRPCS